MPHQQAAPRDTLLGQPTQPGMWRETGRGDIVGVFVAQRIERETTATGHVHRLLEQAQLLLDDAPADGAGYNPPWPA